MCMNDLVNVDMSELWNGGGGLNWMRFQNRLEKSLTPFGQQAISTAMFTKNERILDVGCGWGDTSFEIAQNVGSNGYVRGIDISELILRQARSQTASFRLNNISFECVDAESHNFEAIEYDVIFSRFGIMFFNDPVAAFKNIRTALKKNGRIVFICWQSVNANQWVNLPIEITEKYTALTQQIDPEAPGGFAFGNSNRVLQILKDAGFVDVKVEPFKTKFNVGKNLDEAIEFLSHLGPASSVLDDPKINDEIKSNIIKELRNTLALYQTSQGVELDAATWIFTATN